MADYLERPVNELEQIYSENRLPKELSFVGKIAFVIGMIPGLGLLRALSSGEVTLIQAYNNSPFVFWLCGCALLLSGVTLFVSRKMNQKILESESVQSAISGIEQVEQRIDRVLPSARA